MSSRTSLQALSDRVSAILPLLTVGVAMLLGLRRLDDFDTWWHLAAGRWIVTHRGVPWHDTLSFTVTDHEWINLQWLFDVVIYGLNALGGPPLLVVVSALTFSAAVVVLLLTLRLYLGPVAAALLGFWVVLIMQDRVAVRPEMVSFLLLAVILWLFATAPRDGGRRLWWLVPLMILWVNVHALFVIGVFVIASHMVGAIVSSIAQRLAGGDQRSGRMLPPAENAEARVLLVGAVAVAATLVNPYGIHGMLFPVELLSRLGAAGAAFRSISEFQPPFAATAADTPTRAYQSLLIIGCSVAVVTLIARALAGRRAGGGARGQAGPGVTDFIVLGGLAYLSLLARRNIALFALGGAPVIACCMARVYALLPASLRRVGQVYESYLAIIVALCATAALWFIATNGFYRWDQRTAEFGTDVLDVTFPIRATSFLRAAGLPGRVYNDITSGGYLSWANANGGVFIDGRLEVYDADFFRAYRQGQSDPQAWQRAADTWGINTVLLTHRNPSRHRLIRWLLASPNWGLVYFDEVAVVFVRQARNQELIARARQRFATLELETMQRLLTPITSWQWPAERVQALSNYAGVLDMMGNAEAAMQFDSRLLDLGLPGVSEAIIRLRLAQRHARRGELAAARLHLARAAEVDPANRQVAELRARLGG